MPGAAAAATATGLPSKRVALLAHGADYVADGLHHKLRLLAVDVVAALCS